MAGGFSKRIQNARRKFGNLRAALIVRVWNLGSRLDPKQMGKEKKKKKFWRLGNK